MTLAILFGVLFTGMAIGIPIAWAIGLSGLLALVNMDMPLMLIPQKMYAGMDSFPLLCLPFFILAGELMAAGGLTDRLLNFSVNLVGFVRGGLAIANVLASMLFGGITGAATADASALGSVEIPMMVKNGYDKTFAAAITAASSCIGPIIPPSLVVVIYVMIVKGVSIGGLFAAGMLPGILVGVALMLTCYALSVHRNYPKRETRLTPGEFLQSFWDALLALVSPLLILGGIIGGIFTATEAASIAVIYAFIIGFFVYREIRLADLSGMFVRTGAITAIVMVIIGTSTTMGIVLSFEQTAAKLGVLIAPLGLIGFIITVNLVFFIAGMFLDMLPAILIFVPIFEPVATGLGMHPLHFGMIVIINLVIGLITPPMGQILFVVSPLADVRFEALCREILVFVAMETAVLLIVSYIPFFTLFIPKLMGYI